jgi:hypothetical protein
MSVLARLTQIVWKGEHHLHDAACCCIHLPCVPFSKGDRVLRILPRICLDCVDRDRVWFRTRGAGLRLLRGEER